MDCAAKKESQAQQTDAQTYERQSKMTKPKQPRKYDTYVYYLPELNILAESGSDKRKTFVL